MCGDLLHQRRMLAATAGRSCSLNRQSPDRRACLPLARWLCILGRKHATAEPETGQVFWRNLPAAKCERKTSGWKRKRKRSPRPLQRAPAKAQIRTALGGAPFRERPSTASDLKTLAGQFGGFLWKQILDALQNASTDCSRSLLSATEVSGVCPSWLMVLGRHDVSRNPSKTNGPEKGMQVNFGLFRFRRRIAK